MGTLTEGPFGTYTGTTVAVQVTQDEIIANLNSLKALIPAVNVAAAPAHPDFGLIPPEAGQKLRDEIDALIVVVDAMPVA